MRHCATPTEVPHETVNEDTEPGTFSWECNTTPENAGTFRPTSHIIVDTARATPAFVTWLEGKIWGGESTEASLPAISEVLTQAQTLA